MKRACLICLKTLIGDNFNICPEHGQLPSNLLRRAEECYKKQESLCTKHDKLSKEEFKKIKEWATKELTRYEEFVSAYFGK